MTCRSEDHILALVNRYFPEAHPSLLLGRGDDCAVLRTERPLCISADLFLEGVHFRRNYFTPEEVGHKALAVNISDIAAMGVRPVGFTLCLGLPLDVDMAWLEGFFSGMSALAARHGMVLAGGDLARAESVHVSVTVWGEPAPMLGQPSGCYLTRGAAMPGDSLFLVGPLGLARVGLHVLESMGDAARALWPAACAAHLTPQPQVDAGIICSRAGVTSRPVALMDVSDGLARDLPRMLGITGLRAGSPMGAEILLPEGMLHAEVVHYARKRGLNPVHEAYSGGEDYALLGACAPELLPALHAALPGLMSIGTVTDSGTISCNGETMRVHGFDHFAEQAMPGNADFSA